MHTTRFIVEHVRRTTVKPFDEVRVDFERRLGRFDACEYQALAASENAETARAKIEAMAGTSAFGPKTQSCRVTPLADGNKRACHQGVFGDE